MVDEFPQAQVPGEGGRQEQAGIGHQAMVVKEDADTVGIVLWRHLLGAPCFRAGFCSKTIIPDSEEHPIASSRAVPKAVLRWIRANLWILLLFRVLQAVAAALIVPNCAALLREAVPETRRGRSFGLLGVGIALAAGLGPLIGGVLVEVAGWRAIFFVNLVLVLPALALGWYWLPRTAESRSDGQFDLSGAIMLPVILAVGAALLMAIGRQSIVVVLVGGPIIAVAMVAFARQELRHPDPVFQPRLFARRAFAAANGAIGFSNLAMYTLLLSVPLVLADRSGSSSLQTGTVLAAMSASMIILAPVGGRLADRLGRRLPTTAGLAILTAGTLLIAVGSAEIGLTSLVVGLAVSGAD